MKGKFLNMKIPTFFGFIVIILGIIVTTFLVNKGNLFQINATPSEDPNDVRITNISDTSFSVSYTTDDSVIGTLSYGTDVNNLDSVVLDDRDQIVQKVNKYNVHEITVKDLTPNTNYFFQITSGDKKFGDGESPYQTATGAPIDTPPSDQSPISGKILAADGSVPKEAIVYIKINGAQDLSTLTKPDGSYAVPLNNLRNDSLDQYIDLQNDSVIAIEVQTNTSSAQASVNLNQINPVPAITLSNSYNFSSGNNQNNQKNTTNTSLPDLEGGSNSSTPQILTPESGQEFTDQQPNFDGTAPANSTITITIHSDQGITTTVKANSTGKWEYRPNTKLSPGNHSITISVKDSNGILQTITRQFTVFAAGSEVNQTATPSAASSPSPTITASLTPTPQDIAQNISPVPTGGLSPAPTLPATGNSSVIMFPVFAVGLIIFGLLLFFMTGRKITL